MVVKCEKCSEKIELHEHHVWPKFMNNPHGLSYNGFVSRVLLCCDHHILLHQEVIVSTLRKFSSKPEYFSESKLWEFVPENLRGLVIKEVVLKSVSWLRILKEELKDG
jgi:hypothetical protein